jgi:threonine/homoserine/homoserine lactone efflux protein
LTEFITLGVILGLSAGFAPGPLLALVISETLRHDISSGVRVALSPLFTDLPIIALTLFVLSRLSGFHAILGVISLVGAAVILRMGYENMHPIPPTAEIQAEKPKSLAKGILVNALSPHPYLFWLAVGGPILGKAMNSGISGPLCFITSFYVLLIGSKIVLAVLVGRSKSFLQGRWYLYTMRLLGLVLWGLALFLLRDGLLLLGAWK